MTNPNLWRYRADAVGRTLYRLAWGYRQWQRISSKPMSDGSGGAFNVLGAGSVDSADARFVVVSIQPEFSLSIEEHALRLWANLIRECQEGLPEDERDALRGYLDAKTHRHVWDIDRKNRTMQARNEHERALHEALLKLAQTGEVGRVEKRVVYGKEVERV